MPQTPRLEPYKPTLRNRLALALMGSQRPDSGWGQFVQSLTGNTGIGSEVKGLPPVDLLPFLQAEEGGRSLATPGHRIGGAVNLGMAMMPMAPAGLKNKLAAKAAEAVTTGLERFTTTEAERAAAKEAEKLAKAAAKPQPAPKAPAPGQGPASPKTRLKEIEDNAADLGVSLSVQQGNGGLTVSKIVVPPDTRNLGIGSAVMGDLAKYADDTGQRMLLSPSTSFGGSRAGLDRFYKRHGFKPNTGRSRDLSVSEAMIREPTVTPPKGEVAPEPAPEPKIVAYHGSPHDFDQFSTEHIGNGEGAQAYGHGLYFAGAEKVAKEYRRNLAGYPEMTFQGEPLNDIVNTLDFGQTEKLEGLLKNMGVDWSHLESLDPRAPRAAEGIAPFALHGLLKRVRDRAIDKGETVQEAAQAVARYHREMADASLQGHRPGLDQRSILDEATRGHLAELLEPHLAHNQPGHLYEVGIDADPHAFLDYDVPLKDQPEAVKKVLGYVDPTPHEPADPDIRAIVKKALKQADGDPRQVGMVVDNDGDLYRQALAHAEANGVDHEDDAGSYIEDAAADYLRAMHHATVSGDDLRNLYRGREQDLHAAGVPGIKYFDGGSRTAGDGTRNYVVFNDKLVNVLKKYGWVPGAGVPAAAMMEAAAPEKPPGT